MEFKGTPGPWRLDPNWPLDVQNADGSLEISTCGDSGLVDAMPAPIEEAFANARLIAAAPRMAEVLAKFSGLYGTLWDLSEPDGHGMLSPESVALYDEIHREVNRVLADATGTQPWWTGEDDA